MSGTDRPWPLPGLPADETVLFFSDRERAASHVLPTIEQAGRSVIVAEDVESVLRQVAHDQLDAVILDEPQFAPDTMDLLAQIRTRSQVPIIVLSSNNDETTKVQALDRGADEYITTPCGEREIRSRVQAILRRARIPAPRPRTRFVVDDYLQIDFGRREVVVGGRAVALRPTEFRLLYHLVNNAGRVLTHETLLAKVWGREYRTEEHYVRLYVTYLRQKIEPDPRQPRYILNERGMGYRFRDWEESDNGWGQLATVAGSR